MSFRFGVSAIALICVALSGCNFNVFSPFDAPSGDAQLLSAAQACEDQGDYVCAAKYYAQVSTANADEAISDEAFAALSENGVTMGTFSDAFGGGTSDPGAAITELAADESLFLQSHTALTARLAIVAAAQTAPKIQNQDLRGLVRFMTAIGLVAELLAEDANPAGSFTQADLVYDPSACLNISSLGGCAATACAKPSGSKLVAGALVTDLDTVTPSTISGPPTFQLMSAAISKITYALTNEISNLGPFGGSTSGFASALAPLSASTYLPIDPSNTADSECFRWGLLQNDIGK